MHHRSIGYTSRVLLLLLSTKMGKGGEKSASKSIGTTKFKLDKLETAELRKWAVAYGLPVKDDCERDVLLKELVWYHLIDINQ